MIEITLAGNQFFLSESIEPPDYDADCNCCEGDYYALPDQADFEPKEETLYTLQQRLEKAFGGKIRWNGESDESWNAKLSGNYFSYRLRQEQLALTKSLIEATSKLFEPTVVANFPAPSTSKYSSFPIKLTRGSYGN